MQKMLEDLECAEIRERLQLEYKEAEEEDRREAMRRRSKRSVDSRRQELLKQRY